MSEKNKLSGSIDYLKSKAAETASKSSQELVELSYWELLKKAGSVVGLGLIYAVVAIAGNDVLDISKVQGIIFIFGLLVVMTALFFFWKKDQNRFTQFKANHQIEMLTLAQSSVHAVDLVTNDMRKEMSNMKDDLIDNFTATIDAYQNQVNHLIYEVLNEKRKVQKILRPLNKRKKK
jgi:hypothetical protein